eukprot:SAG22_NODE_298_length_12785_cov_5.760129_11_plen_149_part_00
MIPIVLLPSRSFHCLQPFLVVSVSLALSLARARALSLSLCLSLLLDRGFVGLSQSCADLLCVAVGRSWAFITFEDPAGAAAVSATATIVAVTVPVDGGAKQAFELSIRKVDLKTELRKPDTGTLALVWKKVRRALQPGLARTYMHCTF